MSTLLFRKLVADDRCYFFRATFDDSDDLELIAVSSTQAWKVKLTRQEVVDLAASHSKSFKEYRSIMEKAFADDESGIVLAVKSCTPTALEVSWKKQMTGDAYFNLGGAKLVGTEQEALLAEVIGGLLADRSSHLTRISELEVTNDRLNQEHTKALELLDEANEAKRAFENGVMGKFVSVLNSKKREIASLKNGTQYSSANKETSSHDSSNSQSPSVASHRSAPEEPDSGESTDEERSALVRQRSDAASRRQANSIIATADLNLSRSSKPTAPDRTFVPNKRQRINKPAVQPNSDLNAPNLRRSTRSSMNKSGNSNESRMSLD
uniref:XRCC4 n=1 Tax=Plectus sambesii TaxID=2011161 RepID=A0A914XGR9_9BILA